MDENEEARVFIVANEQGRETESEREREGVSLKWHGK